MGRIRTIKPEVLMDRKAAQLSHEAWRLWVSMWVIADDCGRLPSDPALLAGQVFWGHSDSIATASRALASLRESSMVEFYEVNGETYARIRGFRRHQKIDRPSGPKFPGPDDGVKPQLSLGLASPREPSRSLDPDHDHDLDREHEHDREGVAPFGPENEGAAPVIPATPIAKRGQAAEHANGPTRAETMPPSVLIAPGAAGDSVEGARGKRRVTPPAPEEAHTLATLLIGMISKNHPSSRVAKQAERLKVDTAVRWATTIDKLHRIDGYTWGEIEGMIRWSQRDQFWRGVILGADNLRDKWDKMIAQRDRMPNARGPAPAFDQVLDDAASKLKEQRQ